MSLSRRTAILVLVAAAAGAVVALIGVRPCTAATVVLLIFLVPLLVVAVKGPWSAEGRKPWIWFAFLGLLLAIVLLQLFGCG